MRAAVATAVVRDGAERIALLETAAADLRDAGAIAELSFEVVGGDAGDAGDAGELEVDVTLAD
jgi:hypothetical protein